MRGMCLHRRLGLGVLSVAFALAAGPAAQAGIDPPPGELTGVHAALEQNRQPAPAPDVFERAVLRSQSYGPEALRALEQRSQAMGEAYHGPTYGAEALRALNERSQASGEAWAAATPQAVGTTTADSHGRAEMPTATLVSSSGDDGIAWIDLGVGSAFGFVLAALAALGALALRSRGRVAQS